MWYWWLWMFAWKWLTIVIYMYIYERERRERGEERDSESIVESISHCPCLYWWALSCDLAIPCDVYVYVYVYELNVFFSWQITLQRHHIAHVESFGLYLHKLKPIYLNQADITPLVCHKWLYTQRKPTIAIRSPQSGIDLLSIYLQSNRQEPSMIKLAVGNPCQGTFQCILHMAMCPTSCMHSQYALNGLCMKMGHLTTVVVLYVLHHKYSTELEFRITI